MVSWLITYKKIHGRDTRLVEMPSEKKVLEWITKNASSCRTVLIQRVEEWNDHVRRNEN